MWARERDAVSPYVILHTHWGCARRQVRPRACSCILPHVNAREQDRGSLHPTTSPNHILYVFFAPLARVYSAVPSARSEQERHTEIAVRSLALSGDRNTENSIRACRERTSGQHTRATKHIDERACSLRLKNSQTYIYTCTRVYTERDREDCARYRYRPRGRDQHAERFSSAAAARRESAAAAAARRASEKERARVQTAEREGASAQ